MISCTRGRNRSMRRAENHGPSSRRIRACSAASVGADRCGRPKITDSEYRDACSGHGCERPSRGSASNCLTRS